MYRTGVDSNISQSFNEQSMLTACWNWVNTRICIMWVYIKPENFPEQVSQRQNADESRSNDTNVSEHLFNRNERNKLENDLISLYHKEKEFS